MASVPTSPIESGKSGIVELAVDTTGRKGDLRLQATLITNDPRNPRQELRVSADVFSPLEWEPHTLDFGKMLTGQAASKEIVLRWAKADNPLTIKSITAESNGIEILNRREEAQEGTKNFFVTAQVAEIAKLKLPAKIVIETDYALRPRIEIPISATLLNTEYAVEPESLFFGSVRGNAEVKRTVMIYGRDGKAPKVLKVEDGGLEIATELREEAGALKLVAKLDGTKLTGTLQGEIRLYMESPTQSILAIPVLALP